MADDALTCPLCGFGFARGDTLCAHGCPLGAMCRLVRCPGCGYEFPEEATTASWVDRLLGRRAAGAELPRGVRPLASVEPGHRARVVCLGGRNGSRHGALSVFGFVPGAEVTVLQRRPATVVRVDETELAIDAAIAREILVEAPESDTMKGTS